MKTFKLWFEPDAEIPSFKRLCFEEADLPFRDILHRGIHPDCVGLGRVLSSLRNRLYGILNNDENIVPHLNSLGYCTKLEEGHYYYVYRDLESVLHRIKKSVLFVDDIDYPTIVEFAARRLRDTWNHRVAYNLAQRVYPDFNDLRDFLKRKDKSIKLSGYKNLDNYDLATVLTVDDFTGHDKAIIATAIEQPNFRKTSFLTDITTNDGYLSVTDQFDWFSLEMRHEDESQDQALIVWAVVTGDTVYLMPDPDRFVDKRAKAEAFAKEWGDGSSQYCFTVAIETIERMLNDPNIKLTFEGYAYDDPATCRSPAYMSIRGPAIGRFAVQRYPTVETTNDTIKEILAEHGISMTGRKDHLIEKLGLLATSRYRALRSVFNTYFSRFRFIKIPQGKSCRGQPFPMFGDHLLNQLVLGIYVARHLRGNVILDAACENTAVGIAETAQALIEGKITLECDFIAVENNQPAEVKP